MLRRLHQAIWVALFACFLFVIGSFAWAISHQPVPQQQNKRASETQTNSKSIAPPTIISLNEFHTGKTDKKSETEKQDFFTRFLEFNITDLLLALFTGVLAYKTSGLFRETAALRAAADKQATEMLRSIKAAEKAADAAKRSADSDRPHMLPDQFKISGMRGPVGDDGKIKSFLEWRFINYGRSPAFMKKTCFHTHIGHELPPPPDYGEPTNSSYIVAVKGWFGSVKATEFPITASDAADILDGRNNCFIFGYIEYDDVVSQNHKMRFAYTFDWGQGDASERFRPAGPDTYREYT
jgi:hypothetical protein